MTVSAAIRRMLDAGLSIEQALLAAEAFEAEMQPVEAVLSKRQARNKRYYEKKKASDYRLNSDVSDDLDVSDGVADLSSPSGSSPKPLSPNPHQSIPPSPPKGGSSPAGFDDFWAIYPNKVGKRDAEKAFVKASSRADIPTMMAGLRLYVAKTDDRPWCNPATWLNQDRWTDAPAAAPLPRSQAPPMTFHQQRQQAAIAELDKRLGIDRNDQKPTSALDLDPADWRAHRAASPGR